MSNDKFDATRLNELMGENQGIIDLLKQQQEKILIPDNVPMKSSAAQPPQLQIQTNANGTVQQFSDIENIYGQLALLVQNGQDVLLAAKYAIDSGAIEGDMISGIASLLSALRDTLKEFTKIQQQKERLEQQKELEKYKMEMKKELLLLKYEKEKEMLQKGEIPGDVVLVEFNQEQIIKKIMEAEKNKKLISNSQIIDIKEITTEDKSNK